MNNKFQDFKEFAIGLLAMFAGIVLALYLLEIALTLLFGEA